MEILYSLLKCVYVCVCMCAVYTRQREPVYKLDLTKSLQFVTSTVATLEKWFSNFIHVSTRGEQGCLERWITKT